jgi:hypothetical protein
MSIILFIIIVLVVLALALYCVQLLPIPGAPPIKQIIMALCVLVAILVICDRAGVLRLG